MGMAALFCACRLKSRIKRKKLIAARKITAHIIRFLIPIEGFLLWIVAALFFSVFSFFLSGFFKSGQQYITAFYLIIFFLTVLGGGIIPFLYLPESMTKIAEKTPLYWIVKQMNSLILGEVPIEFWNIVKVLLAGIILFLFLHRLKEKNFLIVHEVIV